MKATYRFSVLCMAGSLSVAAHASCGSAFCTLMTDRYAQGTGEPHLGWSADVRLEAVTQDCLRSGTHNLDASEVTGEETIERHTKNLNLVTTLSYGLNRDWSLSLRIPVVKRDHLHDLVDETTGLPTTPDLTCMQLCAEPTRKQTHPSRSCASNEQVLLPSDADD